jgi:hypothetical protein
VSFAFVSLFFPTTFPTLFFSCFPPPIYFCFLFYTLQYSLINTFLVLFLLPLCFICIMFLSLI